MFEDLDLSHLQPRQEPFVLCTYAELLVHPDGRVEQKVARSWFKGVSFGKKKVEKQVPKPFSVVNEGVVEL